MSPSILCFFVAWTIGADGPSTARYPRADMLIEPAELAKPRVDKGFRILDVRSKDKYQAGHIPDAVWIDHDRWANEYANDLDEAGWETVLGKLGITPDTRVVIYDDARFNHAARIWWLLRSVGVRDVRLLNGGWQGWRESGGAVSKDEPKIAQVRARVALDPQRKAIKGQVLEAIKNKRSQIIDARSEAEFCGIDKKAKRGGAIPGAIHLEWSDAIDAKTGRFKSADELTRWFKNAGIDLNRPSISYCQSGGRAAVMAFTLELMGAKDVRNYYKSWAEWGNADDTPIVTPKKP
jgi:thiosulfate/3-mercaptopyruvate sulfurtransferase